jgi:GNAT superfamily N-acetyltransferase
VRLRRPTREDVPACLALAGGREWPAEELKWRMLLSVGEGYTLEAPGGGLAGTVIVTPYGGEAAAVGMVLVALTHEGRGLDRRLMEHALARIGPGATLLDATPQGRPLYVEALVAVSQRAFVVVREDRMVGARLAQPRHGDGGPARRAGLARRIRRASRPPPTRRSHLSGAGGARGTAPAGRSPRLSSASARAVRPGPAQRRPG